LKLSIYSIAFSQDKIKLTSFSEIDSKKYIMKKLGINSTADTDNKGHMFPEVPEQVVMVLLSYLPPACRVGRAGVSYPPLDAWLWRKRALHRDTSLRSGFLFKVSGLYPSHGKQIPVL